MSVNKVNKTTGDLSLLAGGTLYADNPIGSIIPYGGATAPAGWFICDGTELVRSTYPELFAVIGTNFGTPSDNTKFKLPDLREATTKGVGLTGKSNNHYDADGLALGEFIDDRVQEHTHNVAFRAAKIFGAGTGWGAQYDDSTGSTTTINPQTGRNGATTEVKAVGVNYIIKAVSVGIPADFMSAIDEAVAEATSGIGTIITAEGNVHPTTADAEFIICQATIPAGTWIVNCFSDLNYDGSTTTYNNILKVTGATSKTARTSCRNGGGSMVTDIISINSPGVAYAMGYATSEMIGGADYKQHSLIEAIRVK